MAPVPVWGISIQESNTDSSNRIRNFMLVCYYCNTSMHVHDVHGMVGIVGPESAPEYRFCVQHVCVQWTQVPIHRQIAPLHKQALQQTWESFVSGKEPTNSPNWLSFRQRTNNGTWVWTRLRFWCWPTIPSSRELGTNWDDKLGSSRSSAKLFA